MAAAAAALVVAPISVVSACGSTESPARLASTGSVTVNGNNVKMHSVRCSQLEWFRTIEIGGEVAGATVTIDQNVTPIVATSVRIQNLGGFTGMYSQHDGGSANATLSGDTFTVSGTAEGYKTDKAGEPATADFKITASC
jgi:ipoprotein LpqH